LGRSKPIDPACAFTIMTNTLVLLGDSILDNKRYTRGKPDTAEHLRELLKQEWTVVLRARDGDTIGDVPGQLATLPSATTCAVLSVGGNDAISHIGLLDQSASHATDILMPLVEIARTFRERYDSVLTEVLRRVDRLILCTIYQPPLSDEYTAQLATIPLSVLNDQILRAAGERRIDVLELRSVCTSHNDFVQQIEPSAVGARKIAVAIPTAVIAPANARVSRFFV
jgi:GDSL-like Lipase/Acylhydrolase family